MVSEKGSKGQCEIKLPFLLFLLKNWARIKFVPLSSEKKYGFSCSLNDLLFVCCEFLEVAWEPRKPTKTAKEQTLQNQSAWD